MLPSSRTSALVASSWMKTSSSILLRTSFVFAVAARTTGMKTPSTSVVIRIVAKAARLGAALRRSARSASRRKKNGLTARLAPGSGPPASSRTTRPSLSSITRRRIRSTIWLSCVATITVVPVRLIR